MAATVPRNSRLRAKTVPSTGKPRSPESFDLSKVARWKFRGWPSHPSHLLELPQGKFQINSLQTLDVSTKDAFLAILDHALSWYSYLYLTISTMLRILKTILLRMWWGANKFTCWFDCGSNVVIPTVGWLHHKVLVTWFCSWLISHNGYITMLLLYW